MTHLRRSPPAVPPEQPLPRRAPAPQPAVSTPAPVVETTPPVVEAPVAPAEAHVDVVVETPAVEEAQPVDEKEVESVIEESVDPVEQDQVSKTTTSSRSSRRKG